MIDDDGEGAAPDDVGDGWRLIGAQLRSQWGGLALGVFAGVCWTAAKVSVPKIVEIAIDRGMAVGDQAVVTRCAWAIAGEYGPAVWRLQYRKCTISMAIRFICKARKTASCRSSTS